MLRVLPGPAQSTPAQKLAGSQAGWHYTPGSKSQNVMAVSLAALPGPQVRGTGGIRFLWKNLHAGMGTCFAQPPDEQER
jgi:hypothetical protein